MHLIHLFLFQDSLKYEALVKEGEDSTDLIPKLEDNIPKQQKMLLDEEKVLEEIIESSKGGPLSSLLSLSSSSLLLLLLLLCWKVLLIKFPFIVILSVRIWLKFFNS